MTVGNAKGGRTAESTSAGPKGNQTAQPYRLYVFIIGSFLVVRFVDLMTQDSEWAVWIYKSKMCQVTFPILAAVLSFLVAMYLKSRVPKLMALLLCAFVGGTITLLTSSAVGMMLGLLAGGIVVFDRRHRGLSGSHVTLFGEALPTAVMGIVPLLTCSVLPAALIGGLAGASVVLLVIHFGQGSRTAEVWTTLSGLLAGVTLFAFALRRTKPQRRWYGWIGISLIFLVSLPIGLLCTAVIESHRRLSAIPHVGKESHGLAGVVFTLLPGPINLTPLQHSVVQYLDELTDSFVVAALTFDDKGCDADIEYAQGFPTLLGLEFQRGCPITDAGLAALNCRYLRRFCSQAETKLTDETLQRLDMTRLESLELEGSNFSDAGLKGLSNIPNMMYLSLRGTRVTAPGLKKNLSASELFHGLSI